MTDANSGEGAIAGLDLDRALRLGFKDVLGKPSYSLRAFSILTGSRWRARYTVSSLDKSFDRAEDGVPVRLAGILADLS
jgi:hypothetical protein